MIRLNSDPDHTAKRNAGIRKRFTDPAERKAAADRLQAAHAKWRETPAGIAYTEANKPRLRKALQSPKALANYYASRPAAGKQRTRTVLGWCPAHRIADYRNLVRRKGHTSAEAKAMILESEQSLAKRYVRSITRAMEAKERRRARDAY